MNLEDQVCSLEYAKKLKELGVKQESYFYYYPNSFNKEGYYIVCDDTRNIEINDKFISAFTVAELGEMLPDEFKWKYSKYQYLMIYRKKYDGKYIIRLIHSHDCGMGTRDDLITEFSGKKEADVLAIFLIYLIENQMYPFKVFINCDKKGLGHM
jgi:hypothetical protein